jgi:hypothetical protein
MAKRSTSTATGRPTGGSKGRAVQKTRPAAGRRATSGTSTELEAARRRIRDLEDLHHKVGERLDAAIETIHKILGRSA